MRRLSIRARLTIAFAVALLAVVTLAGIFVYLRVDTALSESIEDGLASRVDGLEAAVATSGPTLEGAPTGSEDAFSQVLGPDGEVLASNLPPAAGAVLTPAETATALQGRVMVDRSGIPGVDGEARMLAGAASDNGGEYVVVAGTSTQDKDETLTEIAGAFAIGAPLALLLASGLGYLLSRRAMQPVDAIRKQADEIGGGRGGERLPLPAAHDEIHALGETLNSMLDRLEAALEREQEFVANASHELRTPLAILKAELELAERDGRDAAELRAAISSALGEVDRMSRLADDLLVAARADRGEIPIRAETTDVGELLNRVAGRFHRRLDGEGRRLVVAATPGLEAELDPLRMEQAVGNLIDNAAEHGEGEVTVSAEGSEQALLIEVGDDGPGFPPEFAGEAFDRLSQADPARAGRGAGLGLAIVKALAEAHGGGAAIVDGAGGRVRITIPQA